MSVLLEPGKFTAATFLVDTGCCAHFHVCKELKQLIMPRLNTAVLGMPDHLTMECRPALCSVQESVQQPINVMGLPMFVLLGIGCSASSLRFDAHGIAHNVATVADWIKFI